MLLAIPTEIVIMIALLLLVLLAGVGAIFYMGARKAARTERDDALRGEIKAEKVKEEEDKE